MRFGVFVTLGSTYKMTINNIIKILFWVTRKKSWKLAYLRRQVEVEFIVHTRYLLKKRKCGITKISQWTYVNLSEFWLLAWVFCIFFFEPKVILLFLFGIFLFLWSKVFHMLIRVLSEDGLPLNIPNKIHSVNQIRWTYDRYGENSQAMKLGSEDHLSFAPALFTFGWFSLLSPYLTCFLPFFLTFWYVFVYPSTV